MIIYECKNHGVLNESTSWVDKNGRIICGKCGKPALHASNIALGYILGGGQIQYGRAVLSNGEILKH